jgi:hypothetical protein
MKLNEKLEAVRLQIKNGDNALADKIGMDAVNAIFTGMRDANGDVTPAWETLMRNFTTDQKELDRLCGKDDAFNNSKWGAFCLAYIAGDATCTADTAFTTGARRSIITRDLIAGNREFQDTLDAE